MGLPVDKFIAATNVNKVVPDYLNGAAFLPKPSVQTISNSMDVGNPSNFFRLLALFGGDEEKLKEKVQGCFYSDESTKEAMVEVKKETGYTMDPHGAVAYLGLKAFMKGHPSAFQGVFLETAHPGKFRSTVEEALGEKVVLPERLAAFMEGNKKVETMENDYLQFKNYLLA